MVAIELKSITRENYFYSISGQVHGDNTVLYYQKTYDERTATEDHVIENGKSLSIKNNGEFTISTRDQGVQHIFLLAEDTYSHCRSEIIHIPIGKESKSPFHLHV